MYHKHDHHADVVVAGAVLTAAGFLWRRAARRHGGLAIPVLAHTIADIGVLAAVFLLRG